MKRIILFTTLLALIFSIGACARTKEKKNMQSNDSKVLVAWFSWSGNTEAAVKHIAGKTGADLFRIERVKPYPTEYDPCTEDAKNEVDNKIYPEIKGVPSDFDKYETVIVAVPVWWYTAPMPVFTFLEKSGLDFSGKTVIPFCTAYTGPYNTLKDIEKATPAAAHKTGHALITKEMGGTGIDKKFSEIDSWLKSVGF